MRINGRKMGILAVKSLAGVAPAAAILVFRPFGLDLNQSVVLAALALVIAVWVTGLFHKAAASILLLAVFLAFGRTPAARVFQFPLSENFITIVLAFLFSQGISNSRLGHKLLMPLLSRYASSPLKLIAALLLSVLAFVFIIPQPFSRVIILSAIFSEYLGALNPEPRLKEKLLFGVYLFSIVTNMFFIRGDIILNAAFLSFGRLGLGEGQWILLMLPPSLLYLSLVAAVFLAFSWKDLRGFSVDGAALPAIGGEALTREDRRNILWLGAVLLAWATEDLHHIKGVWIVAAGTAGMFGIGLLKPGDIRAVKPGLLLFMTAVFSIGGVMTASGTAEKIFSRLSAILPPTFSLVYVSSTLALAVASHMVFGSNMTTLSVLVPGLKMISQGVVDPVPLLLMVFVAVCSHFLLPIHNVLLLLGSEGRHFTQGTVFRFGLIMTVLLAAVIPGFYLPWWRMLGLLA